MYALTAEPSISTCSKQKMFHASNLSFDDVNEIIQNCGLEEAYVEHSKSDKYLETGEQTEVVRNYFW